MYSIDSRREREEWEIRKKEKEADRLPPFLSSPTHRVQSILLPSSSSSSTSSNSRPPQTRNEISSSSSSSSINETEKPVAPSSSTKADPSSNIISPVPTLPSNDPPTSSASSNRRNRDPLPAVLDLLPGRRARWAPPFVWKIDVVRGGMQAVQLGVHYLLM